MLGAADANSDALTAIVHIIQVALTPVFLLSGVATLLNVFSTRLARVADQVDATARLLNGADAAQTALLSLRLKHLHHRALALDAAVALGAAAGASTCFTVLMLFVGEARSLAVATMLFVTFGLAIACTLAAIGAFAAEMLMASKRIRIECVAGQMIAEQE